MSDYIEKVFGEDGILSRRFEGYEPRRGQIQFAVSVDRTLDEGGHLLAECPTGTGKSLGYAVPAVYHAAENGKKILIVTANIALQEQIVAKDLPLLKEILPWPFEFALAKGRNNYLCELESQRTLVGGDPLKGLNSYEAEAYERVRAWSGETETGDKSDLDIDPPYAVWRMFSTTTDDCLGTRCANYDDCYAIRALNRARASEIVVCNYHLLFAHLAVVRKTGEHLVLPKFDAIILDEAHEAADIAREFYGFKIRRGTFRWIAKRSEDHLYGARQEVRDARDELESEGNVFFDELDEFAASDDYRVRFRDPYPLPEGLLQRLRLIAGQLQTEYDRATHEGAKQAAGEIEKVLERCLATEQGIRTALSVLDPNVVSYLEPVRRRDDERGPRRHELHAKQIDVSGILAEDLFSAEATVSTSATLTVGGSFDYLKRELGVPGPRTMTVKSPFDFKRQALFIIPDGLPENPNDEEFPEMAARALEATVKFAGGRTLALFTSFKNLEVAYDWIRHRTDCEVLKQGQEPRMKLVERFKADPRSVLLGVKSFWTGVDVPGDALSCVFIDKIPFPSMGDPVVDAIGALDPKSFFNFSIPRAVITFKQGFGRLIRSVGDRGVVVMLDQRVRNKSYGAVFIKSIPPGTRKSVRLRDVEEFLGEGEAA